ncbi:MAG: hypothetical protein RBS76_02485 [Acholeplasmatales bacterium]|nr:hypothetical protein [Acholeplasmataceae bacterium]MCK9234043.1 hypothetical protein [Acholeplasmataceae bacterium]MCK9289768.1 hypothetical protein [Acholeplasmataceae bacterium]MCK9428061.1 hypothetical protein [Acholeplasmataceae bacterium]MDY0115350.1 hypothetical protein [Acholeplasmatales bacterium]
MIIVRNELDKIKDCFKNNQFELSQWTNYINQVNDNLAIILIKEIKEDQEKGLYSFLKATIDIDKTINENFNKNLDVEIILYLGLCSGAGFYTKINGKKFVLLGVEKL